MFIYNQDTACPKSKIIMIVLTVKKCVAEVARIVAIGTCTCGYIPYIV